VSVDEGGMDGCGENAGGTAGENDPVPFRSRPWEGEQAKERLEAIIHLGWTYGVERESENDPEKERERERLGGGKEGAFRAFRGI